jgi:hypothetical protein
MAKDTTRTLEESIEGIEVALRRIEGKVEFAHRLLGYRPEQLNQLARVMAPRPWYAMRRLGIDSVSALRHTSDERLLALPQFGKKSLAQVHAFLAEREVA